MWLRHHDFELNRMRAGLARIEQRNETLEVLERNQQRLQQVRVASIYFTEMRAIMRGRETDARQRPE